MKRLLTISMILLVTSCVTKPEIPAETGNETPHAGGPMTIYLGGIKLQEIIDSSENVEALQQAFLTSTKFKPIDATGQTRLIFEGLESIFNEQRAGRLPMKAPYGTHPECIEAYKEKYQWHLDNSGMIPASFGKIKNYALEPMKYSKYWTGNIDLCTWIGSDNYYFNISFVKAGRNTLALKKAPFTNTVDNLSSEITDGFFYKLHAKGNGAVIYKNVYKNSIHYAAGDPIYGELEKDCFDTFYVKKPTGVKAVDLADQVGYCMGRCDGIVLNTGR